MIFHSVTYKRDIHPPLERIAKYDVEEEDAFNEKASAEDYKRLIEMCESHGVPAIAQELGRSEGWVRRWIKILGIKSAQTSKDNQLQIGKCCKIWNNRRWSRAVDVYLNGCSSSKSEAYELILKTLRPSKTQGWLDQ